MKAEIISIGTELLLGRILDTNAKFLSQELSKLGIDVFFRQTAGDNPKRLKNALEVASKRANFIITIGGLGPTIDDITLGAVSDFFGLKLIKNNYTLSRIRKYFKTSGAPMPPNNISQSFIPIGSALFKNDFGTAPGIYKKIGKISILLLPGPPSELIPMFNSYISSYLVKCFSLKSRIYSKSIKLIGISESLVNEKVTDLLSLNGPATVGIYAHPREVHLVITVKGDSSKKAYLHIKKIKDIIYQRLGDFIFGEDGESLESVVGKLLIRHNLTISFAESATGGLISHRITNIPGASKYYLGTAVVYSNSAKIKLLGVKKEILSKFGAVSKDAADAMSRRVRILFNSDIGISVTGIAGPGGGSAKKPVGIHFISFFDGKKLITKKIIATGDRALIKLKISQEALSMLWRYLKSL